MGQVSREMNPNPPNGRPRYNLGDYLRQRSLYEGKKIERKRKRKEHHYNLRTSVKSIPRTKLEEHNTSNLRLLLINFLVSFSFLALILLFQA